MIKRLLLIIELIKNIEKLSFYLYIPLIVVSLSIFVLFQIHLFSKLIGTL